MELTHYSNPHRQNKCYQNVLQQNLVSLLYSVAMYTTSIFSHYSYACTPFKVCGCPVLHKVNSMLLIIIVVFRDACLSLCMKDMSGHVIEEF